MNQHPFSVVLTLPDNLYNTLNHLGPSSILILVRHAHYRHLINRPVLNRERHRNPNHTPLIILQTQTLRHKFRTDNRRGHAQPLITMIPQHALTILSHRYSLQSKRIIIVPYPVIARIIVSIITDTRPVVSKNTVDIRNQSSSRLDLPLMFNILSTSDKQPTLCL